MLSVNDVLASHREAPLPSACRELRRQKNLDFDHRLANWKRWLCIRKRQHRRLGAAWGRKSGCLIMNDAEDLRGVREDKMMLEHTKILSMPDPQRGSPAFWKMPLQGKSMEERPPCFYVMTKEEKCEVPTVEYVGVPKVVKIEKDVLPRRKRTLKTVWQESRYRQTRTEELKTHIDRLQPHKPETDDLVIVGKHISLNPLIPIDVPKITVTASDGVTESKLNLAEEQGDLYIGLEVNDTLYIPTEMSYRKPNKDKIYVVVEYDISSNEKSETIIKLTNVGTVTLKFYWKQFNDTREGNVESIVPPRKPDLCFTFNKNVDVLPPGQTINFAVWFKTDFPGTYRETWQLMTIPSVFPQKKKVLMVLRGYAVLGNLKSICNQINQRLNDAVDRRIVEDAINDLIVEAQKNRMECVEINRVDRRYLFQAVNTEYKLGVVRAKYERNEYVIDELEQLYDKVRTDSDPNRWSYLISDISLAITKHDNEEANVLKAELDKIVNKLQKNTFEINREQPKYLNVYALIICTIDRIIEDIEDAATNLSVIFECNYPQPVLRDFDNSMPGNNLPFRCIFGFSDLSDIPGPNMQVVDIIGKPEIEELAEIPKEDVEKRFAVYQEKRLGIAPSAQKKGGKGKPAEEVQQDKPKLPIWKTRASLKSISLNDLLAKPKRQSSLLSNATPEEIKDLYESWKYIIFRERIVQMIDQFAATMDSFFQNETILNSAVKRVTQHKFITELDVQRLKEVEDRQRELANRNFVYSLSSDSMWTLPDSALGDGTRQIQATFQYIESSLIILSDRAQQTHRSFSESSESVPVEPTKEKDIQKDYEDGDDKADLEALLEREVYSTSVHNMNSENGTKTYVSYETVEDEEDPNVDFYFDDASPAQETESSQGS